MQMQIIFNLQLYLLIQLIITIDKLQTIKSHLQNYCQKYQNMSKNQPILNIQRQNNSPIKTVPKQVKKDSNLDDNNLIHLLDTQKQIKQKVLSQVKNQTQSPNKQKDPLKQNESVKGNLYQQKVIDNFSKKNQSSRDINLSQIGVKNPLQQKQKTLGMKNAFQTISIGQFQKQKQNNFYKNTVSNGQRNQNESIQSNSVHQQNLNIKKQNLQLKTKNQLLKKQLELFSQKLDEQIKKRVSKQKQKRNNKYNRPTDPELVQSMELQNAYKKIQIYKREIHMLKSKRVDFDDEKQNQYENKIKTLMQEIISLKQEIKTTKKILKTQQKGLVEVGATGFFKVSEQNEKLKEEIRKLKLQIDQVQRKVRKNNNSVNNAYIKNTETNSEYRSAKQSQNKNNYFDKRSETTEKGLETGHFKKYNTKNVSLRIKTESNIGQQNQNSSSQQQIRLLKYQQKIRLLTAEKARQREIIENLKMQVLQKDKEIINQKEKIETLRKLVKQKQKTEKSILNSSKQEHQDAQKNVSHSKVSIKEEINMENSHLKDQIPKGIERKTEKQKQIENRQQSLVKLINNKKYPRLDEKGLKYQTTFKWNHHQFSSKMKQIQILPHKLGFIKDIHVRYQKGQPKNESTSSLSSQQKYSSFVCQQAQQFIKQIKGGFKNGYLQYLSVRTNFNRKAKFCKYDIEQQCQNFDFSISEEEYPCALYGQSDNQGVKRIGCFIDIIKSLSSRNQN